MLLNIKDTGIFIGNLNNNNQYDNQRYYKVDNLFVLNWRKRLISKGRGTAFKADYSTSQ